LQCDQCKAEEDEANAEKEEANKKRLRRLLKGFFNSRRSLAPNVNQELLKTEDVIIW